MGWNRNPLLFQVGVYPNSKDVPKGVIQDYITIARPDSSNERIRNDFVSKLYFKYGTKVN